MLTTRRRALFPKNDDLQPGWSAQRVIRECLAARSGAPPGYEAI